MDNDWRELLYYLRGRGILHHINSQSLSLGMCTSARIHHLRKGTTNCGPSVERPELMEVEAHFTFKTPHTVTWNPEPSQPFLL